jgi:hypothetical protein
MGLARDRARRPVTTVVFARLSQSIEISHPAAGGPAALNDTTILYRSVGIGCLRQSERAISGPGQAGLTSGVNDQLTLDGDGARTLTLGTRTTATAIAAALQAAVQALVALSPSHQTAYTTSAVTTVSLRRAPTLRSGTAGTFSSVVVVAGGTTTPKLRLGAGGLKRRAWRASASRHL